MRAGSVQGPIRTLREFPLTSEGIPMSVHRNLVAWRERTGDSVHIVVAAGPDGTPRRVTSASGSDPGTFGEIAFSWDGRRIASVLYGVGGRPYSIVMAELDANGRPTSAPRTYDSGALWGYELQWLRDGSGVTFIAQHSAGVQSDIVLVPFREGVAPVVLTRDEPASIWGYRISPDGRHVMYPAEVPRGSSIWTIDLPALPGAASRTPR